MPVDATLAVRLYKTPDERLEQQCQALLRVSNHHDVERVFSITDSATDVAVTVHDNLFDHYTVVASVDSFKQFGSFYKAQAAVTSSMNVLLIPARPTPQFLPWEDLNARFPDAVRVLSMGFSAESAAQHYVSLIEKQSLALACLLNLVAAMRRIKIAGTQTPLDFIRGLMWDDSLAQDRFFGYADPELIPLLQAAVQDKQFAIEPNPGQFHRGATRSFKQTQYDFSNVQLTFHENDKKDIGGLSCVMIEPDMDLYKDLLNHGLLEVLPNLIRKGLTNPFDILALRWSDQVGTDEEPFHPGYSYV